jgi:hypothetical protein
MLLRSSDFARTKRLTAVGLSNDLDWDGESKRIIAAGEGRDKLVVQWSPP